MTESTAGSAAEASAEVGVPSLPQRRPRVREVSSRFMSPLIHSNATPTPTPSENSRSKSVHRRQLSRDENQVPETTRSLDTLLVPPQTVSHNRSLATNSVATVQKKQQQQQRFRHFKENGEQNQQQQAASVVRISSRPDTPIAIGTDRVVPSRYRQTPHSGNRGNPMNISINGCTAVTAATRLLQEATSGSNNYRETVDKKLSRISTSRYDDSDSCSTASSQGSSSCPSSPLFMQTSKATRSLPETRSSVSDVDKWLAERSSNNEGKVTSDCARSLNFSSSVKMGGSLCLPPHPASCVRLGMDARKGRKVSNHQEDVHSLKMLYNHYLQWRLANAKAEATVNTQKRDAEIKLYSMGSKISDLRDEVKKKRSELGMLQGIKTLSMIVEAQMPYLDAWSALEEDFLTSLSGISNALLNSSLRVPVSGEVQVEVKDLQEALSSAVKVMELIVSHVLRLMPKAEEVDTSISELARVVSGERALIEECGDLLSKKYTAQVKECSLRGALIQLHRSNNCQAQQE
ncbi:protein ENDOSPERM DEFECTIVE 1-like [Olea europaea var. sylvestris]|uniref:protein ENDOSPERM DEFECTIVE 1-like n=1 Tax=Olea europaea var. sylvestris TaxID=158386 RepID=UPI000C1D4BE3|nr:protein ENDOSPERM DEFECTIVE 1-like [Olea europaea var. sylvestris]